MSASLSRCRSKMPTTLSPSMKDVPPGCAVPARRRAGQGPGRWPRCGDGLSRPFYHRPGPRTACGSIEAEDQPGEREVDDQTGAVDEGADEGRRHDRRVD